MKTVITISHANRRGLTDALNKIQSELGQGYIESSGIIPASPPLPGIAPPVQCYPPGFPEEAKVKPLHNRRESDIQAERNFDPTQYDYAVEE